MTSVNIKFTGTLTSMVCPTVTLQSTGERLHINSCSIGGGGEVTTGVEDCSPFAEVADGVVTKGVSGSSPHESDGGSEVAKGF